MNQVRPLLVVEDDPDMREALADLLEQEGFLVMAAGGAEEALELLRNSLLPPCLMIVDLLMRGMTGWEFLAEVRGESRFAKVPVIVVSALQNPTVPHGIQMVRKPIDPDELLAAVDSHCDRREASGEYAT